MATDSRFAEMDEETNFYTARVLNSTQLEFKVPAWPFAMWPRGQANRSLYDQFVSEVAEEVQRSMNSAHAEFDNADYMSTATMEDRKWKYYVLDFTQVPGIGTLSSKVLYGEAGDTEILDFDFVPIPFKWTQVKDRGTVITDYEEYVGFKVANVVASGGRKVKREDTKKSALAEKRRAARKSQLAMKTDEPDDIMSG